MTEPSDTNWRYGVFLFPFPPILSLVSLGGMRAFIALTTSGSFSDTDALSALASFVLTIVSSWAAVLLAVVVAVSAFMDARALADRGLWTPNRYALGGVGIAHLAATQILPLALLSTALLGYYCHRRRRRVP